MKLRSRSWPRFSQLAAGLALLFLAANLRADGKADFEAGLKEENPELMVGLYTRAIRSGDLDKNLIGPAFYNRGLAYSTLKDNQRAVADFEASIPLLGKDPDPVRQALNLRVTMKDFSKARPQALVLLSEYPDDAKNAFRNILYTARADQLGERWKEADELLTRLGQLLPDNNMGKLYRARDAAKLGRESEAIELIRQLDNQYTFVAVRFDRAFEALWDRPDFLKLIDLPALWDRDLVVYRRDIDREPNKLEHVLRLMQALRSSGRMTEAVELGEAKLRDIARFTDRKEYEVWIYDELARSNKRLGEVDKAVAAYRRGVDAVGLENINVVNILINGGEYLALGCDRFSDALEFADKAAKVGASAYGMQGVRQIQFGAFLGLDRKADAARIAASLVENRDSSPSDTIETYFLQDRGDLAAALAREALADPTQADELMSRLQVYSLAPQSRGSLGKKIEAGWETLRGDPQVLALVNKIGRIATIPAAGQY